MMEHRGYCGRVEFDAAANVFHGEVVNARDVITFEGDSVGTLRQAFEDSINDYLAYCAERGEKPDKPWSGQFAMQVSPELHRQANLAAAHAGQSLNAWVAAQLQAAVGVSAMTQPAKKAARPRKQRTRT